jgi:hypothetical protein
MYIPKETIRTVRERSQDRCELCGRNRWLEMAHIVAKGMGGRHNEAEVENNSPDNILHLCTLCHRAVSHGEKYIIDGHSCDTCPIRGQMCIDRATALGIEEPKTVATVPLADTPDYAQSSYYKDFQSKAYRQDHSKRRRAE